MGMIQALTTQSLSMKKIETAGEMRQETVALRAKAGTVALVPTSGALHDGHCALIRAAREKAGAVVVSIFVNPLRFGPNENFTGFPRTPEADLARCEELGVDAVFMPSIEVMYPRGFSSYLVEEIVSKPL